MTANAANCHECFDLRRPSRAPTGSPSAPAHDRAQAPIFSPGGVEWNEVDRGGGLWRYVVRLIAFVPGTITHAVSPLWVEFHDACSDRTLDGAGCRDLAEAIAAAEEFLAQAKLLNTG